MDYWLLFWRPGVGELTDAQVAGRLRAGDWQCVPASDEVGAFRRDLIASDPEWPGMALLPRSGSGQPQDRYLAVVFGSAPAAEQVRDLRYVAARNRLRMFDPQAG
ncbi:MAG: hypothetical protein ABI140_20560 [Jatrophihabitantaceae bacterium]